MKTGRKSSILRPPHLLDEGDPVMIGVPEDDRRKQRQRDEPAEIEPGRDQPAPQFGNGDQPDQDRRPEEQRGVFRQQRAAGGGADRQPPRAAAGLQHLGERKQHEAGSHQQRRVRRDDHGADRGHQRDVQKDRATSRPRAGRRTGWRRPDRSPSSSAAPAGSRPAARRTRYRRRSWCRARITNATIGG